MGPTFWEISRKDLSCRCSRPHCQIRFGVSPRDGGVDPGRVPGPKWWNRTLYLVSPVHGSVFLLVLCQDCDFARSPAFSRRNALSPFLPNSSLFGFARSRHVLDVLFWNRARDTLISSQRSPFPLSLSPLSFPELPFFPSVVFPPSSLASSPKRRFHGIAR